MIDKYNYNDEPSGRVDTLAMALDKCERLEKENKRLVAILYNISYQTPALGGNKKDMERALLDIDYLCDLALRPDEIKELEK